MTTPEQVAEAVHAFLNESGVDGSTWYDLGPHMTCREADAFVTFLRAMDNPDAADHLMHGHADADEPTDSHYDLRCEMERTT